MAEIVGRILLALIEGLIDVLFEHTGRTLLSRWGVRANLFVNVLVGVLFWTIVAILLFCGFALFGRTA